MGKLSNGFTSMGREFTPTVRLGVKAKENRIKDFNQRSAESLAIINQKYGKPSPTPIKLVVDSQLRTHT